MDSHLYFIESHKKVNMLLGTQTMAVVTEIVYHENYDLNILKYCSNKT